ncbi:UNVERIFIED_ORG: putative nucleotidyltransferase [Rhizobium esperanzae]|nr:putative nucleotidyltransferase [Rhizobium esperanzae]
MLNDYQKEFLNNLIRHNARFLVIGGVARQHYEGGHTKDLDILIDIDERIEAIEAALQEWKQRYAIHTMLDLIPPLALRPMVQMKFPDDLCDYQDRKGDVREIGPDDGVDVLTSLPGFAFANLYERGRDVSIDGVKVRILCQADVDQTGKQ